LYDTRSVLYTSSVFVESQPTAFENWYRVRSRISFLSNYTALLGLISVALGNLLSLYSPFC